MNPSSVTLLVRWLRGAAMVSVATAAGLCPPSASAAELIRLAPGRNATAATAISADGLTVVGHTPAADGNGTAPFRWTERDGFEVLPQLPDRPDTRALGVSPEGEAVVGYGTGFGEAAEQREAFYWSRAEGVVPLGDLPEGRFFSEARGASRRGEVIVGFGDGVRGREAFVWRRATGLRGLESLDTWPNGSWSSEAVAVSDLGFTVAGNSDVESPRGWPQTEPNGFTWREGFDLAPIAGEVPDPEGPSEVGAMSLSGFWIGGTRSASLVRWNEVTGFETIIGRDQENRCVGISSDAEVIAGYSGAVGWFVWQNGVGVRELNSLLAAGGVDLFPWSNLQIAGLSEDGRVLCGTGNYTDQGMITEAWVARLDRPPPPSGPALDVRLEGTLVVITFNGLAGWTYQPEVSADFLTWIRSGPPLTGTGGPLSFSFPVGAGGRFTRVAAIRPVTNPP